MKKTFPVLRLCVSLVLLTPFNVVAQIQVDWMTQAPGVAPKDLEPEMHLRFDSTPSGLVVDATTQPPNPFDNLSQSLSISTPPSGSSRFEAFVRAFPENSARQGSFTLQFRIVSGSLTLEVGHTDDLWDPADRASYGMTANFFGIHFQPGSEVQIRAIPVQTDSVMAIEANVNYTFTIKWNLEEGEGAYTFFLNGERIITAKGTPYVRIPESGEIEQGVTGFRVLLGGDTTTGGEAFLGELQSTAGSVHLEE